MEELELESPLGDAVESDADAATRRRGDAAIPEGDAAEDAADAATRRHGDAATSSYRPLFRC